MPTPPASSDSIGHRRPQLRPIRPVPNGSGSVEQVNGAHHSDDGFYWWSPNDRDWAQFGNGHSVGSGSNQAVRGADNSYYTASSRYRWDEAGQRYVEAVLPDRSVQPVGPRHAAHSPSPVPEWIYRPVAKAAPRVGDAPPRAATTRAGAGADAMTAGGWWTLAGIAVVLAVVMGSCFPTGSDSAPTGPSCTQLFRRMDNGDQAAAHQWDVDCGRGH